MAWACLARIRKEGFLTPVLILTMSDAESDLADALRAGVRGYLLKDMAPDDVVDAIRRVAAGELVVAPAMTGKNDRNIAAVDRKTKAGKIS